MARSARSPRQGQRRPALALALALALTLTLTLTNPNQVSGGPADRDWRALHRLLCGTLDDGIEARGWADSSELENAAEVHGGGYRMPHACLMHASCPTPTSPLLGLLLLRKLQEGDRRHARQRQSDHAAPRD